MRRRNQLIQRPYDMIADRAPSQPASTRPAFGEPAPAEAKRRVIVQSTGVEGRSLRNSGQAIATNRDAPVAGQKRFSIKSIKTQPASAAATRRFPAAAR